MVSPKPPTIQERMILGLAGRTPLQLGCPPDIRSSPSAASTRVQVYFWLCWSSRLLRDFSSCGEWRWLWSCCAGFSLSGLPAMAHGFWVRGLQQLQLSGPAVPAPAPELRPSGSGSGAQAQWFQLRLQSSGPVVSAAAPELRPSGSGSGA